MALVHFSSDLIEVGVDEAGRGCLAGPVVAAAVILPKSFTHPLLNDSKQINEKNRVLLREVIQNEAVAYAVGIVHEKTIDEINILNASFLAMHYALDQILTPFEVIVVDGNRFKKYQDKNHSCVIKGDGKILSVAAASILAKTYRDDWMLKIDAEFPSYKWNKNKGYPTKEHRNGIKEVGPCMYHRMSFTLLNNQTELFDTV